MTTRHLTDDQLAAGLRTALPAHAVPGLRDRILAAASMTPQAAPSRIPLPTGLLRVAAPQRAILILVALLGIVAVTVVAAGALRLAQQTKPIGNGVIVVAANPWEFGGGHNGDLYLLEAGAPPHRIVGSDGDGLAQECPRFSPDGRRLAYGEARASGPVTTYRGNWPVSSRAVVVVPIDASGAVSQPDIRIAVPFGPGPMVCPAWSPTGSRLAFRVGRDLWIADAGSGAITVTPLAGAEDGGVAMAWSRDGSRIAAAVPGGIVIVPADGGAETRIHVVGASPRSIGWTAGDRQLVYRSMVPVDGWGTAVHVVNADGTGDRTLTPFRTTSGATISYNDAAISPDGTRVAYYQATRQGPSIAPLAIVDVDGVGSPVEITPRLDGAVTGSDVGVGLSGLQWSPDGTLLLLSSIDGVVAVPADDEAPGRAVPSVQPYVDGAFGKGLNLEWSWQDVTWQPVVH